MAKEERKLTTNQGAPIANDQHSLTVGDRGPTLLEDIEFIEKMAHFDRERIPERVVHAKGAGAYGVFESALDCSPYTKAAFLQAPNSTTPVFVRFSTVTGGRGSVDTARDPRGFAVKFYTTEGNYDLVGNNLPVFFIRDAIKFPDMVHAFKGEQDSNMPASSSGHDTFWDFISLTPESAHMIMWLFSDRGTPRSYRMQEGFGVNTYVWVNSSGKARYVKYHWKPKLGVQNLDRREATRLAGEDPDYLSRDLWDTIARGEYPEYDLSVQLMDITDEDAQDFDPLDPTKTWPEDAFPLLKVGRMVLNKNPDNFFNEVEQAAFCPATLVPGIEFSDDKLLQGRTFSYADTQRHRLGPNYLQIPVNRPKVPVANNQRGGMMQTDHHEGPAAYSPNKLADGMPAEVPTAKRRIRMVEGMVRKQVIKKTDDFAQARAMYHAFDAVEKEHLVDNIAADLSKVRKPVRDAALAFLTRIDRGLAKAISQQLGGSAMN